MWASPWRLQRDSAARLGSWHRFARLGMRTVGPRIFPGKTWITIFKVPCRIPSFYRGGRPLLQPLVPADGAIPLWLPGFLAMLEFECGKHWQATPRGYHLGLDILWLMRYCKGGYLYEVGSVLVLFVKLKPPHEHHLGNLRSPLPRCCLRSTRARLGRCHGRE